MKAEQVFGKFVRFDAKIVRLDHITSITFDEDGATVSLINQSEFLLNCEAAERLRELLQDDTFEPIMAKVS